MFDTMPLAIERSLQDEIQKMSDAEFQAYINGVKAANTAATFAPGMFLSDARRGIDNFEAAARHYRKTRN